MRTWMVLFFSLSAFFSTAFVQAEILSTAPHPQATATAAPALEVVIPAYVYVHLVERNAEHLSQALLQAEQYAQANTGTLKAPVLVVLNGEEIAAFERKHYREQKQLVDLAARLAAFEIIEIRVCETTLEERFVHRSELPSFLQPIKNGAAYLTEKKRQGYTSL